MLIEFSVGNYRSFKDVVTLSMVAADEAADNDELDKNNVFKVNQNFSLLKSAAIYGANASGKSNLILALDFMQSFVINSSKLQITDKIDLEKFRLSSSKLLVQEKVNELICECLGEDWSFESEYKGYYIWVC